MGKRILFLVTLITVCILAVFFWVAVQGEKDETCRADAIVVLGAAVWDNGAPSPTLYERTRHGAGLFKQDLAQYLILTGGLGKNPPAEATVMRQLAVEWGIPADNIITENQATSTAESARLVAAIMEDKGLKSALLVSDGFHLPRAKLLFREHGIEVYGSPAVESPTSTIKSLKLYFTFRESIAIIACHIEKATKPLAEMLKSNINQSTTSLGGIDDY